MTTLGSPSLGSGTDLTSLVTRLGGLLMGVSPKETSASGSDATLQSALTMLPKAVAAGHVSPEAAALLLVLLYGDCNKKEL